MFGIKESPPKTPKTERLEHKLQCISKPMPLPMLTSQFRLIVSEIVSNWASGYKSEAPKPHPILIKILRASEATMALSKISLFKSPIAIKSGLSQEERNIENFLL